METAAAPQAVKTRLSLMMFLQYAIWGAWLPILYPFLLGYRDFDLSQTGLCLAAGAVGAIFGPFIAGQLADRMFSTEKLLAISHLFGAGLVLLLSMAESFPAFLVISFVYGFVYAPTISLTNSLALTHLKNRDRDFGPVRLWGTIGWIAAGILVGQYLFRYSTPDVQQPAPTVSSVQIVANPEVEIPRAIAENPQLEGAKISAEELREKLLAQGQELVKAQMLEKQPEMDTTRLEEILERMPYNTDMIAQLSGTDRDDLISDFAETTGLYIQESVQDRDRSFAFVVSSILGVIMGFYCLSLPRTPPTKNEKDKLAWAEALREVSVQPLITLFLIAVPVSMIHQFYFVFTSDFVGDIQNAANSQGANNFANAVNQVLGVGGGGLMTIGQMSEIIVLGLMPFLTKIFNRKTLLMIGIVAYAARMAIFAFAPTLVPVLFGVALHGLCFGCFIFVAYMVVDEHTSKDVRATAQNLFNLVIIGIGIIVGSYFATGVVATWASKSGTMDFTRLFSVPMWMAIACLVAMLVFYPSRSTPLADGGQE
ncbi:MAG: MFS transporter [Phycisphaerales bacterium]|nr:MFS transporter [Phycisphaerales bacterium]